MVKTIVTIGYHNGELEWGRRVRSEYQIKGLQGNRNIYFREVHNSDVGTGLFCKMAESEIAQILQKEGFGLWIDIHCGFDEIYWGKTFLDYLGLDDAVISKAKLIEKVSPGDLRRIPGVLIPNCPRARADAYFPEEELNSNGQTYQKGLERTLRFINEIYDIH